MMSRNSAATMMAAVRGEEERHGDRSKAPLDARPALPRMQGPYQQGPYQ